MEALEYIKKFKMDQPNYSFDRNEFMDTFGKEFNDYLENPQFGIDPETGKLPYPRFKEIVKNFELKFNSISEAKPGKPLSRGLWNAFYAIHVIPVREKLFPKLDAKIKIRQIKSIANNPQHPKYDKFKDWDKGNNNPDTQDKI